MAETIFWCSIIVLITSIVAQVAYYFLSPLEAVGPSLGVILGVIGGGAIAVFAAPFLPVIGAAASVLGTATYSIGLGALIGNWGGSQLTASPVSIVCSVSSIISVLIAIGSFYFDHVIDKDDTHRDEHKIEVISPRL